MKRPGTISSRAGPGTEPLIGSLDLPTSTGSAAAARPSSQRLRIPTLAARSSLVALRPWDNGTFFEKEIAIRHFIPP
jgi:hypothetical protein